MPWNEPGQNGKNNGDDKSNDPWGGKGNQSPPDLDKIFSDLIKKLRGLFTSKSNKSGGGASWKPVSSPSSSKKDHHYGFGITLAVLIVIWAISGLFIVNPAEQTVVLRFGKYADVMDPGLHWIARFIDSKYTVDVQKTYAFALQGDFLTKSSEQGDLSNQIQVTPKNSSNDQSKNLVNVELNVQYRISDPQAYLFNIVNPDETVQQVAASALSDMIGQMKLDEVLTTGREFLSSGVLDRIRAVMKNYNGGIEVLNVTLRKVQAPDQVRTAFSDVNRADQDRATFIQQAQAYASKVVPLAQGDAARIMADANAYQQQIVLNAQANVARYQALAKAYANSPEVTRERMYLEAIQNVLSHTTTILVAANASNNMMYLPLDKLLKQDEQSTPVNLDTRLPVPQTTQAAAATTTTQTNSTGVNNVTN